MDIKKIDLKTWVIIALGIALIISFFFGQKNTISVDKNAIDKLHKENELLLKSNDSLSVVNKNIDSKIKIINNKLDSNAIKLANTQSELDKLKKRKNETIIYVNRLSANGVSNAFSDYLTKSTNSR